MGKNEAIGIDLKEKLKTTYHQQSTKIEQLFNTYNY